MVAVGELDGGDSAAASTAHRERSWSSLADTRSLKLALRAARKLSRKQSIDALGSAIEHVIAVA